jgi:hypothetical protein
MIPGPRVPRMKRSGMRESRIVLRSIRVTLASPHPLAFVS